MDRLHSSQDPVFYQEADKLVRCQNVIARYTKALAAQDVPTENSS